MPSQANHKLSLFAVLKDISFIFIVITIFLLWWVKLPERSFIGRFDAAHFFFLFNHYAKHFSIFTTQLNYPYGLLLTSATDASPLTGIISKLISFFSTNPFHIYNLTVLSAPYITALVMYFIAWDYTHDRIRGILSSLLFSLSYYPFRRMLVHGNLMNIGLAIIPVYMFYKLFSSPSLKHALAFGITFGLLIYLSMAYVAFFLTFFFVYYLYYIFIKHRNDAQAFLTITKYLIIAGFLAFLIALPQLILLIHHTHSKVPLASHLDLFSIFLPAIDYPTAFPLPPLGGGGFVVGIPLLFAAYEMRREPTVAFALIAFMLSLGPWITILDVKILPNPFSPIYAIYPFSMQRTPDRIFLITFFFVCLAASRYFKGLIMNGKPVLAALLIVVQLLTVVPSFTYTKVLEDIPKGTYYFFPYSPLIESPTFYYPFALITISNSSTLQFEASRPDKDYFACFGDLFTDTIEGRYDALRAYLKFRGIDYILFTKDVGGDVFYEKFFNYSTEEVETSLANHFPLVYECCRVKVFRVR